MSQVTIKNVTASQITIGSKKFTENIILSEIVVQLLKSEGLNAVHRRELGGTRVLWSALIEGNIDVYPEYSGTLRKEIFHEANLQNMTGIKNRLSDFDIAMTRPLGFNNTYALGMMRSVANRLRIDKISDLRRHPQLTFGFTNEFMDRGDGWRGLRRRYNLPQQNVRGLDHDLAYRGLESGRLDVVDLYSTDAEISYYDIKVLRDDLKYFPDYEALVIYRKDLNRRYPRAVKMLNRLSGAITTEQMMQMNARVKLKGISEKAVAADFIRQAFDIESDIEQTGFWMRLLRRSKEHLILVSISLTAAMLIAIPLGVAADKLPKFEKAILGITGVIQTIPSLALLVFMIPLLGIGGPPAMVALFLYSLLPIVRNTFAGLRNISSDLHESAIALGLSAPARLRLIELPMASSTILAGIKTAAVINVGTATLGALIGAGGYGQPILTGIRLDDMGLILEGALPAAFLALLVQGLFDGLERLIVPRGLRL